MLPDGLVSSFSAAIQASLSVLLVIFYGVLASQFNLLDSSSGKSISKVCVKMFLPALLLTKIGSELHAGSAHRYVVILIWALICHLVSFLIGMSVHILFDFPDWITAALMFNNTTSYPLLLIQSLNETGILSRLIVTDESTRDGIERAKSYFLVFATVSSCLTFAVGPRLIDTEHAPDPPDDKPKAVEEDHNGQAGHSDTEVGNSSNEQTSLLPDGVQGAGISWERRAYGIGKKRWERFSPRVQWWLLFLYDFINAPLIGALLGTIIGLIPALHAAFFNDTQDGGIFNAWLTASLKNIGQLFVPLPVVVAGVSLSSSMRKIKRGEGAAVHTPWTATMFVLVVRFVLWPAVSIPIIYLLASKTNLVGTDPMLWFTLMVMPTGPPAMKLIAMVEVSGATEEEENRIAKLLTISYVVSPLLAFTIVGSLSASQAAIGN